ncbi:mannosyltransferase [Perkinsus olseni]|uniref:Mannosyltransferase n=2 Tax=Perkinsus olseni TaxID=32597 RepID=A0A7J6MFN2_PEROL|nr:mannosyltransferase [Perkinsus olseni]
MVQYSQRGRGKGGKGKGSRGNTMTKRSGWKNSGRKGGKGKGRKEHVTAEELDEALLRYKGEDALAKKYDEDLENFFMTMGLFLLACCIIGVLALLAYILYRPYTKSSRDLAVVMVLGDIGHSPRMQYHAVSLAEQAGLDVVLLGYPGSKPMKEVVSSRHIEVRHIRPFASTVAIPYIVYAACKLAFEGGQLLWILLFSIPRPKLLMVQTPPAIPTLMIASMVASLRRAKLIVDFHNLAYTILGEKLGERHWLVRLSRLYESFWASKCDYGLCVTHRMGGFLRDQWKVSHVVTCYDRPLRDRFRGRTAEGDREGLYQRLHLSYGVEEDLSDPKVVTMVSSTSWTPDEDFMMLLPGLLEIDYLLRKAGKILVFFITGKGPCKEAFVRAFDDLHLSNIRLYTPWLSVSDYPLLLGSVDVGISLHQSSSGLDLPMKVVDMLGAELPVMGRDFEAFGELGGTGADAAGVLTFNTSHDVTNLFNELLLQGRDSEKLRSSMMEKAREWRELDWSEQWAETVLPSAVNHKSVPDNLYLQGYGRQFGDKMTYSVGLSYGSGLLVGGTFGLLKGLQKGGATSKLRVNAVMNAMSTQGPALANQAAIITMYYVAFNGLVSWARGGKDDQFNAVGAGALSGALFKATSGSWIAVAKYSAASAAVFTVVDFAIRNNYV